MDLLTQQNNIKNYIETNYPLVLAELQLPNVSEYISDFVNLDKYKKNIQLFYDFNNYAFENLSNESDSQTITPHIYLFFRNDNTANLHDKMLKYASCFYEMVKRNQSFGGIVDFVRITNMQIYEACEAKADIKAIDFTLEIKTEID